MWRKNKERDYVKVEEVVIPDYTVAKGKTKKQMIVQTPTDSDVTNTSAMVTPTNL